MRTTRRAFLAGAVAGGALHLAPRARAEPEDTEPPPMPTRPFGKTGVRVSLFGLGCFPLGGLPRETEGVRVVLRALERGCTYLDTAPSYRNGRSERRVGAALRAWDRSKVIVATKTHTRRATEAQRDLEGSLERLGVERIDLVQVHAVRDREDLRQALDPETGPLAALHRARDQGLVRWIGVTGHWDPAVMRRAIETEGLASVLIPLNCIDPHYVAEDGARLSFVDQTLPAASERGIARVAMKVFASGRLPAKGIDARRCLRFTYGLDVSTVIVGCRTIAEVDVAAEEARRAEPMSETARETLLAATRPHAGRSVEWYKRA